MTEKVCIIPDECGVTPSGGWGIEFSHDEACLSYWKDIPKSEYVQCLGNVDHDVGVGLLVLHAKTEKKLGRRYPLFEVLYKSDNDSGLGSVSLTENPVQFREVKSLLEWAMRRKMPFCEIFYPPDPNEPATRV